MTNYISVDPMPRLSPDSALEAFAHCCTESEIRDFLNTLTERGRTRLETHGHIAISRALESNKESTGVLGALLDRPEIQVNRPQVDRRDGNTALHTAVLLRDAEAVRMLLDCARLDPNVGNRTEDTPVHVAAQPGGSLEILRLLISDPRVNIAALNSENQSPLHIACKLRRGKDSPSKDSSQVEVVRELLAAAATKVKSLPEFLRQVDALGRNALHLAAESGLDATVGEILLQTQSSDHLALVHDNDGYQAVHLATRNGHLEVVARLLSFGRGRHGAVEECLSSQCSLAELCPSLHLYQELLRLTTHQRIADFLLTTFYKTHIEGRRRGRSLLHWAVTVKDSRGHGALLVGHILKWRPERANEPLEEATAQTPLHVATIEGNHNAVEALCRADGAWDLDGTQRDVHNNTALDYAFESGNRAIRRVLMNRGDVKEHLARLHKNRETYVIASNAILVVAVLIATLTYARCMTAAEVRKASSDGSLPTHKFRFGNTVIPTRIAFFLSTVSTILAAFAALPFSFGLFFVQTVDDHYVRRSLHRTRVLIVLASYFLMLSLGAIMFAFVCSQYIAPYIDYQCEVACEIVLAMFVGLSMVFLATNAVRFWKSRRARGRRVWPRVSYRPLVAV